MTEELKPCPFCGSDSAVLDGKSDSCRVRCESCGVEGRPSFFNSDEQDEIDIAEEEARYGWNTRATPPASTGVVPEGWRPGQPITEEMHVAACKVLHHADGLDGLPQRMMTAMLAAAPTHDAARLAQTSREIEGGEG
jgi:hypothetical protein